MWSITLIYLQILKNPCIPGIKPTWSWCMIFFICCWIFLRAFYFVPLIYISVFGPVPYCLDDFRFVVEPEVRQVDSSSFILLSQDCFGYQDFLYFHTNCEIICSSSVKNTSGSLIGIALNLYSHYGEQCRDSLKNWK